VHKARADLPDRCFGTLQYQRSGCDKLYLPEHRSGSKIFAGTAIRRVLAPLHPWLYMLSVMTGGYTHWTHRSLSVELQGVYRTCSLRLCWLANLHRTLEWFAVGHAVRYIGYIPLVHINAVYRTFSGWIARTPLKLHSVDCHSTEGRFKWLISSGNIWVDSYWLESGFCVLAWVYLNYSDVHAVRP